MMSSMIHPSVVTYASILNMTESEFPQCSLSFLPFNILDNPHIVQLLINQTSYADDNRICEEVKDLKVCNENEEHKSNFFTVPSDEVNANRL